MKTPIYNHPELKKLREALETLGASPNAITVYLSCFLEGKQPIGKIAKEAGLDRSSAYLACDQLVALGLAEKDRTGAKSLITAVAPTVVMARLRTMLRRIRRQHDSIDESLPQLLAAYSKEESKPVLQFYSGSDGLRKISDDVLENAVDEILLFTNQRTERKVFTEADHKEFIAERIKRGLSIRVIAATTDEAYELAKNDQAMRRQTRLVSGEPFTSETYIYGDKVAMLSFSEEVVGFVVRSSEFAKAQRYLFEQIWNQLGGEDD